MQVEVAVVVKQMQTCKFHFCSGHKKKNQYFPNGGSINQCECVKVYLFILLLCVTVSNGLLQAVHWRIRTCIDHFLT